MRAFHPQRLNLCSCGVAKVLGGVEARVLEILWERGGLSVRDVVSALKKNRYSLSFNATMTILNRLVKKGVVKKAQRDVRDVQKVFVYTPTVDRCTFLKQTCCDVFFHVLKDQKMYSAAGFLEAVHRLPQREQNELRRLLVLKQKRRSLSRHRRLEKKRLKPLY